MKLMVGGSVSDCCVWCDGEIGIHPTVEAVPWMVCPMVPAVVIRILAVVLVTTVMSLPVPCMLAPIECEDPSGVVPPVVGAWLFRDPWILWPSLLM